MLGKTPITSDASIMKLAEEDQFAAMRIELDSIGAACTLIKMKRDETDEKPAATKVAFLQDADPVDNTVTSAIEGLAVGLLESMSKIVCQPLVSFCKHSFLKKLMPYILQLNSGSDWTMEQLREFDVEIAPQLKSFKKAADKSESGAKAEFDIGAGIKFVGRHFVLIEKWHSPDIVRTVSDAWSWSGQPLDMKQILEVLPLAVECAEALGLYVQYRAGLLAFEVMHQLQWQEKTGSKEMQAETQAETQQEASASLELELVPVLAAAEKKNSSAATVARIKTNVLETDGNTDNVIAWMRQTKALTMTQFAVSFCTVGTTTCAAFDHAATILVDAVQNGESLCVSTVKANFAQSVLTTFMIVQDLLDEHDMPKSAATVETATEITDELGKIALEFTQNKQAKRMWRRWKTLHKFLNATSSAKAPFGIDMKKEIDADNEVKTLLFKVPLCLDTFRS